MSYRVLWVAVVLLFVQTALAAEQVGLLDVYQAALEHDPIFKEEGFRQRALEEEGPIGRSQYLPRITLEGGIYETDQELNTEVESGVFDSGRTEFERDNYNVTVRQPIIDLEALFNWRQAAAKSRAAALRRQKLAQDLLIRVAENYFNWLDASESVRVVESEHEALTELSNEVGMRNELGLSDDAELLEVVSRLSLNEADAAEAGHQLALADQQLSRMTGLAGIDLHGIVEDEMREFAVDEVPIDELTMQASELNLELLALAEEAKSAEHRLRAANSAWLPKLEVQGTYGKDDSGGSLFGDARDVTTGEIGIVLRQNLFMGGQINHASRKARFEYEAEMERLNAFVTGLHDDISIALAGVKSSYRRLNALKDSLLARSEFSKAQLARAQNSLATNREVLDSYQEESQVAKDYSRARYDYLLSVLNYKVILGTLSSADIDEFDGLFGPSNTRDEQEG